jgi:hypothetical protein
VTLQAQPSGSAKSVRIGGARKERKEDEGERIQGRDGKEYLTVVDISGSSGVREKDIHSRPGEKDWDWVITRAR